MYILYNVEGCAQIYIFSAQITPKSVHKNVQKIKKSKFI